MSKSYIDLINSIQRKIDIAQKEADIKDIIKKTICGHTAKIGIFGVTGVGKSSLLNSLAGCNIAMVSDVSACTRIPNEIVIKSNDLDASGVTLIDVPGVGERIQKDNEYYYLYESVLSSLDLVIWVIKADDRSYSVAEATYNELIIKKAKKCPVLFVINQIDKVEPLFDKNLKTYWDNDLNEPKIEKEVNILKKICDVSKVFNISTRYIQTSSTKMQYNIPDIMIKAIEIITEKKQTLKREIR